MFTGRSMVRTPRDTEDMVQLYNMCQRWRLRGLHKFNFVQINKLTCPSFFSAPSLQFRVNIRIVFELGYTISLVAILLSLMILGYFRWVTHFFYNTYFLFINITWIFVTCWTVLFILFPWSLQNFSTFQVFHSK